MREMLLSERLLYRSFEEEDYSFLRDMLLKPEVTEFLPGPKPFTEEVAGKWFRYYRYCAIEDQPNHVYLVIKQDTLEKIGYAGVQYVKEFDLFEIFYGFDSRYWNLGYATESAKRMKELASTLGKTRLVALADTVNVASNKVLKKIGYIYDKTVDLWGLTLNLYFIEL